MDRSVLMSIVAHICVQESQVGSLFTGKPLAACAFGRIGERIRMPQWRRFKQHLKKILLRNRGRIGLDIRCHDPQPTGSLDFCILMIEEKKQCKDESSLRWKTSQGKALSLLGSARVKAL